MPEQLLHIDTDALLPDPDQPRKTFLPEELQRIADSIRARGVLQPLRVSFDRASQKWRIITGESRWRAAPLAGLSQLPCLVVEGEVDAADLLIDQISENSVRHNLRPVELAKALARLKSLRGWTGQELAAQTGLSGATISRGEALLDLPPAVQEMVDAGALSESTAYEISHLPELSAQTAMAEQTVRDQLTRNEVIRRVRAQSVQTAPAAGAATDKGKSSRLGLKFDDLSITLSSGQPLAWKSVIDALDLLLREAKTLSTKGKSVSTLADVLRIR